jgi:GMP synthase (glutamine-hydrolysing)
MYRGKPPVFDAFTSHADEVTVLPPTAHLLASNDFSRVQAVAVESRAAFWAVQYHPEYDLHEVARLCVFRVDELVRQGTFRDRGEAEEFVERLETLHRDPTGDEIRSSLGIDGSLLDATQRTLETRNWIEFLVKPGLRG